MTAINELKRLSNRVLINGEFRESAATEGLDSRVLCTPVFL